MTPQKFFKDNKVSFTTFFNVLYKKYLKNKYTNSKIYEISNMLLTSYEISLKNNKAVIDSGLSIKSLEDIFFLKIDEIENLNLGSVCDFLYPLLKKWLPES